MKKTYMIMIFFALLIVSSSISIASYMPRYGLQEHSGIADTSNTLRSSKYNGANVTEMSSCSTGLSSKYGTYPVSDDYEGDLYNFLIAPSSGSIRLINSNCTTIYNIPESNVEFISTLTQLKVLNNPDIYALLGYNTVTDMVGIYTYRLNASTLTIDKYKQQDLILKNEIPNIDTYKFEGKIAGLTCGISSTYLQGDYEFACGTIIHDKLYYYNIENDTLTDYNLSTQYLSNDYTTNPYAMDGMNKDNNLIKSAYTIDYNYNGNMDFFFTGWQTYTYEAKVRYIAFDMETKSFVIDNTYSVSVSSSDYIDVLFNDIYAYPCQVGGAFSEWELCINLHSGKPGGESNGMVNEIVSMSNSRLLRYSSNNNPARHITPLTLDYTGDTNFEILIQDRIYDSSYNILKTFNYSSMGNWTKLSAFAMDVTGDKEQNIIFSNGKILNLNGTFEDETLDFLDNNKIGYIVAGDLNNDRENEIIYSDLNSMYIYSTNPTNDYIFTDTAGEDENNLSCEFGTEPTINECDSLVDGYNTNTNSCTRDDIYDCYNLIPTGFTCDIPTTPTYDYCDELSYSASQDENDCTQFLINYCYYKVSSDIVKETSGVDLIDKINNNKKTIFGLLLVVALIFGAIQSGIKNTVVIIFVGIIGIVIGSLIGLFSSQILIILLISLVILLLLGLFMFKGGNTNE